MEVKKEIKPFYTEDFWFDLYISGYIEPEKILVNEEDIKRVREAMETLEEFRLDASINLLIMLT